MADEIRRLIRVRTDKGARFKRDGFGKKSQISDSWRKPRGQHNKQREQKKAKGNLPKPGFGSPVSVRGMHPSGFYDVLVFTEKDLDGLNPKTQAVRISAQVGHRKRVGIQEKALSAGLKVLNTREVSASAKKTTPPAPKKVKEDVAEKKEPKKKAKPVPVKKEKDAKKVKEEKKDLAKSPKKKEIKAEPAEETSKKAKKPKVQKAEAKAKPELKPKKSPKQKDESAQEKKTKPKAAQKPAARPKKKGTTGVKDNE